MLALAAVAALTMVCNLIGYGGNLAESIPGMVILCFISLLGLTAKELLPTSLPAVTYIGVIGMLAAMPASPIAEPIIYWTDKIDVMASITPILCVRLDCPDDVIEKKLSAQNTGCFLSFAKNPRVLPKTCIAGRRLIK